MAIVGTVAGAVLGAIGQFKMAKAAKKAERLRERAMNPEALRKRREIVREGVLARAQALSAATAQGASDGSGLAGGRASITAQQNRNTLAVSQDQEISSGIFRANRQYTQGGTISSIGGGVSD